jgi:hypothetical protein
VKSDSYSCSIYSSVPLEALLLSIKYQLEVTLPIEHYSNLQYNLASLNRKQSIFRSFSPRSNNTSLYRSFQKSDWQDYLRVSRHLPVSYSIPSLIAETPRLLSSDSLPRRVLRRYRQACLFTSSQSSPHDHAIPTAQGLLSYSTTNHQPWSLCWSFQRQPITRTGPTSDSGPRRESSTTA